MNKFKLITALAMAAAVTGNIFAADLYVSSKGGKNKNPGTKEAPLKNIWKALDKAKPGDVIHIAEGKYSGKMSCGWIDMRKPVTLLGGYAKGFGERNPMKYHTLLRPPTSRTPPNRSSVL